MSQGGNFNMDDPAKQESIRRGHHEYIPTAGKHGSYVPRQYKHQEYPKMLGTGKFLKPQFQDFKRVNGVEVTNDMALTNFQLAMKQWDEDMTRSIVHNKAEESQWLKENG